jgi:2-polyprenyl-6-methoxyphenol hydroxylase-like FAD-dependent oxidoreductase
VEESAIPAAAHEWLGKGYWFVLPPGEMMLCYQVPAKDPRRAPGRDWNYVWYRPVTQAQLRDISTDASGKHYGIAMPPPLIRPDIVAKIKDDARGLLAPHIAEVVVRSQPFFQAIFDAEAPHLAVGRAVLVGDAAFVARPHVGMGVTKGALDALCLAQSIERSPSDLDTALARYGRLRGEFGRRCVARGRRLGSYIEARSRPGHGWTEEQLDQRPERVLHEVAAALADLPELAIDPAD